MGQEVKNPLRAQSKYGLMGSSAKTGKKIFEGHRSTFWIKMQFGIGHPPHLHINCSLHVLGRAQGSPNLQTEFNYLDSFKSYGIFSDFVVPMWSPSSPRCPHIVPTSSPSSQEGPHVVSMVCGLHMLSLSSPRRPCHPCVVPTIPTSSRGSPHHAQPPRYPLYPPPTPWGSGGPESVKMQ